MAWFFRVMFQRRRSKSQMTTIPEMEERKDDSSRVRLAADVDEGSISMEEEAGTVHDTAEGKEGKKPPKSCFLRIKRIFRNIYKFISSVAGLLLLLIAYSFMGAAIFRAIEGPNEEAQKTSIITSRTNLLSVLEDLSSNFSHGLINASTWNTTTTRLLEEYEGTVLKASQNGVTSSTSDPKWSFWGSMFFCGTIYTTIGYGHIAPSTDLGRVMTMVYAAIGIPLALVCLADLGKHFTLGLKLAWAFCRRHCYKGRCRRALKKGKHRFNVTDPEGVDHDDADVPVTAKHGERVFYGYKIDDEFNIPIIVAIGILVSYIILGSFMYGLWEDWSYLECFYFVFISISTIGFGDVLPAHPKFFLLSSVYVFIGLSLVSMCVNVAIEFFSKTIDKAKVNIDRAKVQAKVKAKEAKEKMHEVSRTIDRAKDRAKVKVSDLAHKSRKSFREGSAAFNRSTPSSDDVNSEVGSRGTSPIPETEEAHQDMSNNVQT